MNRFAIVTDSAADLPPALVEKYGLHVVPLHVSYEGVDYADGVDIDINQFCGILEDVKAHDKALPVTSQPTPGDFLAVYRKLAASGVAQILSVHLAGALSGTIEGARMAARALAADYPDVRVTVYDTCSATVGEGAMVLEAAVIAQAGGTVERAVERMDALRRGHKIYFVPDNLDNLVKGGRASKFQGLATSLLDIKIVVSLSETGAIEVVHKCRGLKAAATYLARQLARDAAELGDLAYYKLYLKAPHALEELSAAVDRVAARGDLGGSRFLTLGTIGPVIATHVGLGAMGLMRFPLACHSAALDDLADYLTPHFA